MTTQAFQMQNRLEAVDPMVQSLSRRVAGSLASEAQFRFDICVSEALTNLVLHAKTQQTDAPIDLNLTFNDGEIIVELFDPKGAAAFDIRDHARSLEQVDVMAESGRGLGLILECADSVEYGAIAQRNRLSLAFRGRD